MPVWTSVTTVKKSVLNNVGGFPRQPCKRGGDIDTWLRIFLAGYQASWSNYIGAIYFRDSVNMVTRQFSTELYQAIYDSTIQRYIQEKLPSWRLRLKLRRFLCRYTFLGLVEKALNQGVMMADLKFFDFVAMPLKGCLLLFLIILPPSLISGLRERWRVINGQVN
jgi:hypothetical protein